MSFPPPPKGGRDFQHEFQSKFIDLGTQDGKPLWIKRKHIVAVCPSSFDEKLWSVTTRKNGTFHCARHPFKEKYGG